MVTVNATKLMVAFYRDRPDSIVRTTEFVLKTGMANPVGAPHRPVLDGVHRALFGLGCVFPAFIPLVSRSAPFSTWDDLAEEDPASTLVAMDRTQDFELLDADEENREEFRFPIILWAHRLERVPGTFVEYGAEDLARFELIFYHLYEPGWKEKHFGFIRFDRRTNECVECLGVDATLRSCHSEASGEHPQYYQ